MTIRLYFVAMSVMLLSAYGCADATDPPSDLSATPTAFNTAKLPTVEFEVPDMMCPEGCGVAVKEILAKQPGAKDVLVDFEGKTAMVAIEEGKFDSDKALAALVDRQFSNSSLKEASAAKPQAAEEAVH